jgi:hypothetical protein
MPPSYLAAAALMLAAGAIGARRPSSRSLQIITALVLTIALFTVMLIIAYLGVIVAAWAAQFLRD